MGKKDDTPGWIKIVARALAFLIMYGCKLGYEFAINPNNHVSFEINRGQVAAIEGVSCHGDPEPWEFSIFESWYAGKHYHANVRMWLHYTQSIANVHTIEIKDEASFSIESCGQQIGIAQVWSIDGGTGQTHLRVDPAFRIRLIKNDIPALP